jgi:lipopolysaccharide transport system permease protein
MVCGSPFSVQVRPTVLRSRVAAQSSIPPLDFSTFRSIVAIDPIGSFPVYCCPNWVIYLWACTVAERPEIELNVYGSISGDWTKDGTTNVTGYFSRIWTLRYFWMALVRIDLRNRYRRSILGIGWSLLHPIAMTVVLCVVFSRLFNAPVREFAPFLLSGLTLWGFIMAAVMQGCQCFFLGESYIRQQPAPLAIYPLRTTLGAGFHFLLGFAIAVALVWWVNGFGNLPAMLSLVPTFALLFVIGWSLAICTGVANVMFQDSQHLIEVLMQIMFYVTPIMYKPEMLLQRRVMAWFVRLNPLAAILELIRKPLLEGQLPSAWAIGMGTLSAVLAAGVATIALRRYEKRMIFYL